jgi:hypothetical protein
VGGRSGAVLRVKLGCADEASFAAHLEAPHVKAFWESATDIYDREEQIHTFFGPQF